MDRARNTLRSKASSQEHLNTAFEQMRQHLTFGSPLFDAEASVLLVRLHEFGASVSSDGLESAAHALIGSPSRAETTLELVSALSDALCRDRTGITADIFKKSLQEMFFFATGIEPELPCLAFGERLEAFLKRNGSKGWIRLFLLLHTTNAIRIRLDGERPLRELSGALEELCEAAVRSSMASHKKWFDMTQAQALALLESVTSNMFQNSCLPVRRAL